MANTTLFPSLRGALLPKTDAVNHEQAPAYALPPRHALAQFAATGCLHQTFYASADDQLQRVLALCDGAEPDFLARLAVYSRGRAFLKDMPALLCAVLSVREPKLHERVFPRVIDSARMLRTYVQILRSGVVGRRSLGTAPKRLVREWLSSRDEATLFRSSVGQSPSLADVIRMVHPKPDTPAREALYGYLLGCGHDGAALPPLVRHVERFRAGEDASVPDVPFTMLTALPLSRADWAGIARQAPWQTLRMNLNAFARHGAFEEPGVAEEVAARLSDPRALAAAKAFPYQLLVADRMASPRVPAVVRDALRHAMELAIAGVPAVDGPVVVCPDVSGSMQAPVTGHRPGAASSVRCVDVAALLASAFLRRNRHARVIPFESAVVPVELNAQASVLDNAAALAALGGGGTDCSAPLRLLNQQRTQADLVVFVSDSESWADPRQGRGTALLAEWQALRHRNPRARLVCLDLQPNETTQAPDRPDILNVGGFSDEVFAVIADFAQGRLAGDHWVSVVEATPL